MFKAIPEKNDPKSHNAINPISVDFVQLLDGNDFDVKMQYPLMQMNASVTECFVREEVYQRLLIAQNMLPKGVRLRIWDAWRPFSLQQELYEKYSQLIINRLELTKATLQTKKDAIAKYISFPDPNRHTPPVHTTGGAIDVTLVKDNGKELDMGTGFDDFSEKAKTNYYEIHECNTTIRNNRRLLYNCMIAAGFENLPSEWWHYDFGDKYWAYYKNTDALYTGIFDIREIICK